MFLAAIISGSRDFTLHFNFWCSARVTFDRDFDYFADAYISVMSWMVYTRARLKPFRASLNYPGANNNYELTLLLLFVCIFRAKGKHSNCCTICSVIYPVCCDVCSDIVYSFKFKCKREKTASFNCV